MSAQTIVDELASAVGEWAAANFDFHGPQLGIAEEAGEFVHAVLKAAQGIRGTPEEHVAAMEDALADIIIFAAHLRFKNAQSQEPDTAFVSNALLGRLFTRIGDLLCEQGEADYLLDGVLEVVDELSGNLNVNLDGLARTTWDTVSARNWRRFPKNGVSK